MRKLFVAISIGFGVAIAMWLFGSRRPAVPPSPNGEAAELLRQRVVLLRGPLNDEQATAVIARLLFLQHENPQEPITLVIDSPGGLATAAIAVIDTIKDLTPPVRTRCEGSAHGAAAVILACGQRGERVVTRGSALSLTPIIAVDPHTPDSDLEPVRQLLARVVATGSGRRAESVAQDFLTGRSFSPAGAVEYGLADRVAD